MKKEDIQKIQDLYNQWIELKPALEKGIEQWQKANELSAHLREFYFHPEWQYLHENFEDRLETKGNYSVLSEDAIWNALSEQYQLALQYLKLSTAMITQELDDKNK